jgi:hypothetical protein
LSLDSSNTMKDMKTMKDQHDAPQTIH